MSVSTERLELTERQAQVLGLIISFVETYSVPPTIREIKAEIDVTSVNGVMCHIRALRQKGWLKQAVGREARSYVPTGGKFVWVPDDK